MNEAVITANLNNARCIVERNHFGYDTFVNICSGKTVDVAWTFGNWASFGAMVFVFLLLAAFVGGIIWMMISNY